MLRFQFKYHVVCSVDFMCKRATLCTYTMHNEELRVLPKVFGVASNTVNFRVNFRLNDAMRFAFKLIEMSYVQLNWMRCLRMALLLNLFPGNRD